MRSRRLIFTGLLLIAAALILALGNEWQAGQAARRSDQILKELKGLPAFSERAEKSAEESETDGGENAPGSGAGAQIQEAFAKTGEEAAEAEKAPAEAGEETAEAEKAPAAEIDGDFYIGILEIPSLGLTLPVRRDLSAQGLRSAPCRYKGDVRSDDLIIAAHNYQRHFGGIGRLAEGEQVIFTDAEGEVIRYEVTGVEELPGTALQEMEAGEWDLTLFTCTVGGARRVTVRCQRSP